MNAPCDDRHLTDALQAYRGYLPTASEHLREIRERWVPVTVHAPEDRAHVVAIASAVLDGGLGVAGWQELSEEHQIAVALCATRAWAETMWNLVQAGHESERTLTQRLFAFLAYIPLDHATLAVRSYGQRDGGAFNAMKILIGLKLTAIPEVAEIYFKIGRKWRERGSDWPRRLREEQRGEGMAYISQTHGRDR